MTKNEAAFKARKWFEIDATNVVLGDLAVMAANILRGKSKPTFTPNIDCGDFVIIRNAKQIKLTGKKLINKKYYSHSLYIGGLRTRTAKEMIEKYPEEMIVTAVSGMIPKNRLGKAIINKLFVYADQGKPHDAQKPTKLEVK
ncbi:MAG: 50S ribosomal protein L13 [Mycoplasmataceae bacterium]|nr:50S ribosomal protein L13 [Mycoplasmataceae bacterium]